MVEKLEHHGLVRLLGNGYKIQIVAIQLYKETGVLFYLISMTLPIQTWLLIFMSFFKLIFLPGFFIANLGYLQYG